MSANAAGARVLVPVELESLVIGKNRNQTAWADVTPDFELIATLAITLGNKLLPDPFTPPPVVPQPGVHLHWTIPEALTHGLQGQASATAVIESGRVTAVRIENPGFGYVTAPTVAFDGGGGGGATAVTILEGDHVSAIQVTSGGVDYEAPPTVAIQTSSVIRYPDVPDRWFVLRMHADDASRKIILKSWIVESNALHLDMTGLELGRIPVGSVGTLRPGTPSDALRDALATLGVRVGPGDLFASSEAPGAWHLLANRTLFTFSPQGDSLVVSVNASITWPTLDNPDTPFMFLGMAYGYTKGKTTEPVEYIPNLNAIGPGDPQFAAFYPNCRSVFGFYDHLEDLPNGGNLTYLVAGYYSDPARNPLYGCDTEALWMARMQELEWCLSQDPGGYPAAAICGTSGTHAAAVPPPFPADVLCHAMIYAIDWRGPNADYTSAVPSGKPKLALGNTSAEALSALIASMLPPPLGPVGPEEVLNAFQYDLLDRLQEPDGVVELELAMHQNAFGSHSGGAVWQVREKHVDDHASSAQSFDPIVGKLLTELNDLQESYDAVSANLKSLQWQTYSVWYKKLLKNLGPSSAEIDLLLCRLPGFAETPGNIMDNRYELPQDHPARKAAAVAGITVKQIIELLGRLEKKIAEAKLVRDARKAQLDETMREILKAIAEKMPEYELAPAADLRFWSANDPAVLFAGEGIDRSFRYGHSGRLADGERLPCRVSGQTITGLTVAPEGYGPQTVTQARLQQFYGEFPQGGPIPAEILPLFIETLLLDTTMDRLIALAAFQLAGVPDPTPAQISQLAGVIAIIQTSPWNAVLYASRARGNRRFTAQMLAEANGLVGTLPYKISVVKWAQPWIPLLIQWNVAWYPSYESPKEVAFCNPAEPKCQQKWIFDEVDFKWNTDFSPLGTPASRSMYEGTTALMPHAPDHLKDEIEKYIAEHPGSPYRETLAEIAAALGTVNVLSQNLGGFNQAVLQQLQTLQLPVIDLFNASVGDQVAKAIDGNNHVAPVLNTQFNPIRSGHFRIGRLWIVDAFGQVKKVVDTGLEYEPVLAKTIATEGVEYKYLAQLPARIAQSSRLHFKWLMASDDARETNSDPATSPLCGWILPNYFDHSIMVYEADGRPSGALQLLAGGLGEGGSGVRWVQPPGTDTPVGTPPALGNRHLQGFVTALLNYGAQGKDALSQFIHALEDALETVVATGGVNQSGGVNVLFGRPLAVVRVSVQWALEGLPGYNQSWAALDTLYHTGKFETGGFTDVEFLLRFGDIRLIRDGMIGYFLGTPEKTDYQKFYATLLETPRDPTGPYVEYGHLIHVTCNPAAKPVMLTMIVDPRVPIHITSDGLPTQVGQIPPFNISEALKKMDITFQVGPVINDETSLSMPLPSQIHGVWSWMYHPDVITWRDEHKIDLANAVAQLPDAARHLNEGWLKLSEALADDAAGRKSPRRKK
jgi:hypothetical protein